MGALKPLLNLGGKTLVARVIASLQESGMIGPIVVVTGHRGLEVARAVHSMGVRVVYNENYAEGEMLSSVLKGLEAVGDGCEGFLLAFADQPAVLSATVCALVLGFREKKAEMALPEYLGKRGHPVVLSAKLIPAIRALVPGETLRNVVHNNLAQATLVKVDDASILEDLDTPEDFARAEKRYQM
jgi:CTP:molybdopterin cytidylyltransferase MocA